MTKPFWVIGNWKQNPLKQREACDLANAIVQKISHCNDNQVIDKKVCDNKVRIGIAPSFVHLSAIAKQLEDSDVVLLAQDVGAHSADIGAYTGEVSAGQVAMAGASLCLLGHSECRQYQNDNNERLLKKITFARQAGLGVVFCVGESQAAYQNGDTKAVLTEQLSPLLLANQQTPTNNRDNGNNDNNNNDENNHNKDCAIMIAYEPIWAIGTGLTPSIDEIVAAIDHIKQVLVTKGGYAKDKLCVLYGGSVNANNIENFVKESMIDGVLVGGASLNADEFVAMIDVANDRVSC